MTRSDVTFRANRDRGRHGWLRLTPAYSVDLVEQVLNDVDAGQRVLDPFCGTGTTALACATRGIECHSIDINPFLVWFARAKTAHYREDDLRQAMQFAGDLGPARLNASWTPTIHAIERWWASDTLEALSGLHAAISGGARSTATSDLLKVAFCRTMIRLSNASFRHQSMSFQRQTSDRGSDVPDAAVRTLQTFADDLSTVVASARSQHPVTQPAIRLGDARRLDALATMGDSGAPPRYDAVITSPPYPNRMSYVRELRPYMYWLGFLETAADAGELDWRAIGGTWGRATSNLAKWEPTGESPLPVDGLSESIDRIEARHTLLGRYVRKYVTDTAEHLWSLRPLLADGARVTYIVGNSRFFDTMLDTEQIYAELFRQIGLDRIEITPLRRRTSKRELWEFAVSGRV